MELKYSSTGIPYIEIDPDNRIAFSSLTASDDAYSHILISGRGRVSSPKKNKSKKIFQSKEHLSVIATVKFGGTRVSGTLNRMALKKFVPQLKEVIGELTNKEGMFPKKNLPKLGKMLESIEVKYTLESSKPDEIIGKGIKRKGFLDKLKKEKAKKKVKRKK